MQKPENSTKTIFHERNDLHGGYNMNIRCNQKFMFCKDRGIDFSINYGYYIKIK